jgi:hypothetical protein
MKKIPPATIIVSALVIVIILISIILVEMQHHGMIRLTPIDLPYGLMRAGENIVALYRFNKTQWYGELIAYRMVEKLQLEDRCPGCTEQILALELERELLIAEVLEKYNSGN